MAIIRVNFAARTRAIKSRLAQSLPTIVCDALSCDTEPSKLDGTSLDDFELYWYPPDEDDVTKCDFLIAVESHRLAERDAKGQAIAEEIEVKIREIDRMHDLEFGIWLPNVGETGLWYTFTT